MTKHHLPFVLRALLVLGGAATIAAPAYAALDPRDPPAIMCFGNTLNSTTLKICSGPSGVAAGLTLQWKKLSDWEANGWDDAGLCALSLSGQPSLQHPGKSRWELLPGECVEFEVGDINFDETGVSGQGCALDALECGTDYIFRAFAHAGRGMGRSDWTEDLICSAHACPGEQCTHTFTYWKTHGTGTCHQGSNLDEWPPSALPMTLGTVVYDRDQLCASLNVPAAGNGLVSLAHQLIAAKLNMANLANACGDVQDAIAAADLLIGDKIVPPNQPQGFLHPALSGPGTLQLNAFNNGGLCDPNCFAGQAYMRANGAAGDEPGSQVLNGRKSTWGKIKSIYR